MTFVVVTTSLIDRKEVKAKGIETMTNYFNDRSPRYIPRTKFSHTNDNQPSLPHNTIELMRNQVTTFHQDHS